jgi:hypothetical protein
MEIRAVLKKKDYAKLQIIKTEELKIKNWVKRVNVKGMLQKFEV